MVKKKSFNTQKQNKADNDFGKDLYKLLNIAFYGKKVKMYGK